MKKVFQFSLGVLVAFASLFVSCDDGGNEGGGNNDLFCNVSVTNTSGGSVSITDYLDNTSKVLIGATIEVVAVPESGYEFLGWFIGNSDEPVSTNATLKFVASRDVALVAKFYKQINANGYEYVDLGLPSGLMWAAYNVGATKPEEYGGYYAWGETEEKTDYSWETYKWCNGSAATMTKYCTDSSYGTVDNKTVLDPEDDVAHVEWGGSWRMPTFEEQKELLNNCDWTWTTLNGVNGYRVTGPNGNSIFLPAAGFRNGSGVFFRGSNGDYWSGLLNGSCSDSAYYLYFESGGQGWGNDYRCGGRSVRPVCK